MDRLESATQRFDALNAEGPETTEVGGVVRPKEVVYGERMTAWLARLEPEATDALRLAVRAQHLGRFQRPRSAYPMDTAGYRAWRRAAAEHHAALAVEVLSEVGYSDAACDRVRSLILKRHVKVDAEAQTLEDVACLVFLEHYLADFAASHDDDKVVDIIRKTWPKMSARGHAAASGIAFGEREGALVTRALHGAE